MRKKAKINSTQPARKSYFFGKGYADVFRTVKGAWDFNAESIKYSLGKLKGLGGRAVYIKAFLGILYVLSIISIAVFGSVMTVVISLLNIAVIFTVMALVYVFFTVVWLADRIYLAKNKIFVSCSECKEKQLIPTYICPKCNAKHTNLTPGVYGILKRRCNCGEKLPSVFFNGRKNLEAECTYCGHTITDRESRPICIPVVGGRSVGKTAFITAFSKTFIETVAKEKGLKTEFYNDKKKQIYEEITSDFVGGNTRMTGRTQNSDTASSVSFSFFVKHRLLKPDRLFHIYDIAGEIFTDSNENEVQRQYEYCQGIVFMVDPFSLPSVAEKYRSSLTPADIAGTGKADLNLINDVFISKLRKVTGLSEGSMSDVPLAVVIGKADSGNLFDRFSEDKIAEKIRELQQPTDRRTALDSLCRDFLIENGMESFVNVINSRFKTNSFFVCSAIGHSREEGSYMPKGVIEPMNWIISISDPKLAYILNGESKS